MPARATIAYAAPVRSLPSTAVRSALVAVAAGVATAEVVSVICWLPDAGVSGRAGSPIKAGLLSFLAAQHGGITVDGVAARFLPLGMALLMAVFIWRAGQSIADVIARDAGDETVPTVTAGRLGGALLLAAIVYAGCCVAIGAVSKLGTSHAPPIGAPLAGFIAFLLIAGAAMVRVLPIQLKPWLVGAVRGAVMATAVYLGAGALLVAGSLIVHAHRVIDISRSVGGGLSGLPVLVIGLLCAPNAAIAGSAYLAGPGFAVGSDTTVNAFAASHGLLPALPVLGAIPDGHGANPVVLALMALVPLLAAVCVARAARRAGDLNFGRQVGAAAAGGVVTGAFLAVAAWLGGGSAGTGRLRTVGASSWQVGIAVAVVVAVLSVLAVIVLAGWDHFVPPRPTESTEPPAPTEPTQAAQATQPPEPAVADVTPARELSDVGTR